MTEPCGEKLKGQVCVLDRGHPGVHENRHGFKFWNGASRLVDMANGACPVMEDGQHCDHWWDCSPCHACGYDGGGEGCDCPRHNPGLYDENGDLKAVADPSPGDDVIPPVSVSPTEEQSNG